MKHESAAAELVAAATHRAWSILSLCQALVSLAGLWILFPLCFGPPPFAQLFFGQVLVCGALCILGCFGTSWHWWAANEHRKAARKRR